LILERNDVLKLFGIVNAAHNKLIRRLERYIDELFPDQIFDKKPN